MLGFKFSIQVNIATSPVAASPWDENQPEAAPRAGHTALLATSQAELGAPAAEIQAACAGWEILVPRHFDLPHRGRKCVHSRFHHFRQWAGPACVARARREV